MEINHLNKALFEDMSAHYMDTYHFTPLTANVFTFLMFDFEQNGFTFEEILEATCASKSSISNTLNRLQQSNHIEFISKLGERKRYYRINKGIFKVQFQDSIAQLKKHKRILERFGAHRFDVLNVEDEQTQKLELYIKLQENTIHLFEQTLEKLTQIKI